MDVAPSQLAHREFYNILISVVAPRPIAWVSSLSASGQPNLAPFSFFNAVCAKPPLLAFAPGMRLPKKSGAEAVEPAGAPKDTLRNVRETGEFVINMVTFELAEAMNLTSGRSGGLSRRRSRFFWQAHCRRKRQQRRLGAHRVEKRKGRQVGLSGSAEA